MLAQRRIASTSEEIPDERDRLRAIDLFRKIPYKENPYCKKTWGHPLHSLCSYQGKLKPAIAHWLIELFTTKGSTVLDPLGGVGTIAFEAALQNRIGISNDLSPFASVVAHGKLRPPTISDALAALHELKTAIESTHLLATDHASADFGLNGTVRDYFHSDTLQEILAARRHFLGKDELDDATSFVKACLLHILHGNRPYALSRNSHSLTPYSPRGAFEYKSVIGKLEERIIRLLNTPLPAQFLPGRSSNLTFGKLVRHVAKPVDTIITSPPFLGMRFDRPNWMRLWFCGWGAMDFHGTKEEFLERRQVESIEVYAEFFTLCATLLKSNGLMIMHVGGSDSYDMLTDLERMARENFKSIGRVDEPVTKNERHGIRDKGTTSRHHYLFLEKRD